MKSKVRIMSQVEIVKKMPISGGYVKPLQRWARGSLLLLASTTAVMHCALADQNQSISQEREMPAFVSYPSNPYWTSRQVNWYYNPAGQPAGLSTASVLSAIQVAAARWSAMCNVSFNYLGTTTALAQNIAAADGKNVFGWGTVPNGNRYGFTRYSYTGSQMVDADVVMDTTTDWSVISLDGILTQSIGHVLGLDSSLTQESVMYFMGVHDTKYLRTLRGNDAVGCAALYGAASTADSDRLFNWAEANYPQYLSPVPSASGYLSGYYYRYYASTNSYVGTKDGSVFYMGPNGVIESMGTMASYTSRVLAAGY